MDKEIKSPPRLLVTSASRKIPLLYAAQKAIRKIHPNGIVFAGDSSNSALARYVLNEFWHMPPVTEYFLQDLINGCRDRGITAILPTRDDELIFWSKNRGLFESAGISVIVSKLNAVSRCIDKLAFGKFGQDMSLPFIQTSKYIDELSCNSFVVKERFGSGSRSIGVGLSKACALAHALTLVEPIYQPHTTGKEISVDAWLTKNHRVKGIVMRRREVLLNGESQVSTTFRNQDLERFLIPIFEKLELEGPVVMQAFIDDFGLPQIIECNARFGGASTTAIAAGLDSLYWSILQSQGEEVDHYSFCRSVDDIRQVRIPSDIYTLISKDDTNI